MLYPLTGWQFADRRGFKAHPEQGRHWKWTKVILLCTWGATAVLAVNIILTTAAVARAYSTYGLQGFGSAILYEGSCSLSKNWTSGLHIVINVFSTLVLGASNYCMQSFNAPSRKEVNDAHSRGKWLDIGTPS
ncbi:hypothetical protein AJ79_10113 [Helicocarpus griseus UAMH5409]|uniref:DUF6536 domain-containing protein n=1 Tax=Helicocarpus griseus UAMH5409 TaxID=1447875 RepID=A0A2B7WFH2_9EURO|nr:hypothetical protein AJ79_10113 [Helicocarpus griseus UAMH5409]